MNLPITMKTRETKDSVIVSIDKKMVDRELKNLTKDKLISVLLYSRGWQTGGKKNGI